MPNYFFNLKRTIFILLINLIGSLSIYAQNNYYFSTNGNDSFDGLSEQTPWKSTNKFNSQNFLEGDVIHFKRGDVWENGATLALDKGITIKSYGMGDKPIISNLNTLALNWTLHSQPFADYRIWEANTTLLHLKRLFVDGNELLSSTRHCDLGKHSIGINDMQTQQRWFFNETNSTLYLVTDNTTNPNSLIIKASNKYFTISGIPGTHNVTIKDIDIRGGYGPSIKFEDSNNIIIQDCIIGKHSETGILFKGNCKNAWIKNNIIDSGWDESLVYGFDNTDDSSCEEVGRPVSHRGVGDGIIFTGRVHKSYINNNEIKNWGHTGIEFLGGVAIDSLGVNNNHVSSNNISTNTSYGRAIGIDGIQSKCQQNVFRYNHIKDCKSPIQFNGNNNTFHHNIVEGTKNSPCEPNKKSVAIESAIYGQNYVCQSIRIDNNLFINNESYGISINNYFDNINSAEVSNIYIRNNILIDNNLDSDFNESLLINNFDSIKDVRVLSNLIYDSSDASNPNLINYRGNITDVENTTAAPNSNDIFSNNIHDAPSFIASTNYNTNYDSPCIDSGTSVEYTPYAYDFDGDPFPSNRIPDIGPQEFLAYVSILPEINENSNVLSSGSKSNIDNTINIYPNPVKTILNINTKNDIKNMSLFDINGNLILLSHKNNNTVNLESLSSGVYILKIETMTKTYFKKIIKK